MSRGVILRLPIAFVLTFVFLGQTPTAVQAQPAPTFRSACADLRRAIREHRVDGSELVTIEVEGTLTIVHSDGALVYLGMCKAPDLQVLCVTYESGERKVGDRAILIGSYIPRGPDHVQLDPCLPHEPD
jgi:hypothetical protein